VNWYGATAMRHWVRWRPRAYAGISDPDAFFTELGEEMAAQVEELADYLAGEDRPDEGYLDRVARLFTVRMVAEEIVLPQRVWPEPSPGRSRERGDRQRALRRAGAGVPGPPGVGGSREPLRGTAPAGHRGLRAGCPAEAGCPAQVECARVAGGNSRACPMAPATG
jgi:hypothetical protein